MITKEKLIERVDTLINLIEKKTDGDTMSLIYELIDIIGLTKTNMNINKQIKTKEEATQYAMEWQDYISNNNLSYQELAEWGAVFEALAIKFNLQEEFKENGII